MGGANKVNLRPTLYLDVFSSKTGPCFRTVIVKHVFLLRLYSTRKIILRKALDGAEIQFLYFFPRPWRFTQKSKARINAWIIHKTINLNALSQPVPTIIINQKFDDHFERFAVQGVIYFRIHIFYTRNIPSDLKTASSIKPECLPHCARLYQGCSYVFQKLLPVKQM